MRTLIASARFGRALAVSVLTLALAAACGDVAEVVESAAETVPEAVAHAGAPLVPVLEFEGVFDPETGMLELTSLPYPEPVVAGDEHRTVSQAMYCEGRVTSGAFGTFSLSTVAEPLAHVDLGSALTIGTRPDDCVSDAELSDWRRTVYDVTGTFCARVRVTSRFDVPVSDVVAEVVAITPPEFSAYEYIDVSSVDGGPWAPCCGTGADPEALPDGAGEPSAAAGGMFLHGDLGPGESGAQQWTFRNPGGVFRFRGRLMARFPELPNGVDDNCDGVVDDGLGLFDDGATCRVGADCASGACVGGACVPECDDGLFGETCASTCPGGATTPCNGHGTCDDGRAGSGACMCSADFVGAACDDCAPGYWGATCAACPACQNGGVCADGIDGDGTCACPEGYIGDLCETEGSIDWTNLIAQVEAGDAATRDEFGCSVSVSGDTAVIGAWQDDDGGSDSGSAYVFVRAGDTWTEQAKLTASDASALDAYSDDGGVSDSGSAYVFVRAGDTWTEQAQLTASDAALGDHFGWSVSVSGDTAVIGAHGDGDAGVDGGSAYVFVRSGETWTQQAKLTASDAAGSDHFGRSVSVSGATAVIGAHYDDTAAGGNAGSAHFFGR